MTDILSSYEQGLERLLQALGREHPRYVEALTLQTRLRENITATRRYGDTETRRSERAQVIESINRLAIDTTDARLDEWCRPQQAEREAQQRPVSPEKPPSSGEDSVEITALSDGYSLGDGALDRTESLPNKTYAHLIGREELVDDITTAFRDPKGKWIVTIDGLGGIGKTALAREVVGLCLDERLFDVAVWESAVKQELTGSRTGTSRLTYEAVLNAIGRRLGALDVPELQTREKEKRVTGLLHSLHVLVILDNLETAAEDQNQLAGRLLHMLNPSKALLTSRYRFVGEQWAIHLKGLDPENSIRFIRQDALEKHLQEAVDPLSADQLLEIAHATGGSPLALKLVVGQLGHLPVGTVLRQLREVQVMSGKGSDEDYRRFYKFVFMQSWRLLSEDAQRLLIALSHFVPNVGGTYEAIKATSRLSDREVDRCIDSLWRLSFLEIGQTPAIAERRYYLHPLTQYFVLADIVNILK